MAAILHLPYREPGLFNPENCWNNSGSFEFDATAITAPVLTCLASDPIWGNMWIPYLDRVRMSRLKVVRDLGMMEMGCLRRFWKSLIQIFLCYWELALVAFVGIQSASPPEAQRFNSYWRMAQPQNVVLAGQRWGQGLLLGSSFHQELCSSWCSL